MSFCSFNWYFAVLRHICMLLCCIAPYLHVTLLYCAVFACYFAVLRRICMLLCCIAPYLHVTLLYCAVFACYFAVLRRICMLLCCIAPYLHVTLLYCAVFECYFAVLRRICMLLCCIAPYLNVTLLYCAVFAYYFPVNWFFQLKTYSQFQFSNWSVLWHLHCTACDTIEPDARRPASNSLARRKARWSVPTGLLLIIPHVHKSSCSVQCAVPHKYTERQVMQCTPEI